MVRELGNLSKCALQDGAPASTSAAPEPSQLSVRRSHGLIVQSAEAVGFAQNREDVEDGRGGGPARQCRAQPRQPIQAIDVVAQGLDSLGVLGEKRLRRVCSLELGGSKCCGK